MVKKKEKEETNSILMDSVTPEKVMDRSKLGKAVLESVEIGLEMLRKTRFTDEDMSRLKVMKHLNTFVNSGVALVQMEVTQERLMVIQQRMAQLGFGRPQLPAGQTQ